MNDFKKNVKKVKKYSASIYTCKKVPGPKLKNSRNYTYSACCDYNCVANISRNINNDVNRR